MIRLTPIASATSSTARRSDERATLVEQAHGALLVLARQHRQAAAELGLDGVDQPVERAVQRRHAHGGDDLRRPTRAGRRSARASSGATSVAPTASTTGLRRRATSGCASITHGSRSGSASTTCDGHVRRAVGEAARTTAATTSGIDAASTPARRAERAEVDVDAERPRRRRRRPSTCGPGWPSTNGSIVNSRCCTAVSVGPTRPSGHRPRPCGSGAQPPITRMELGRARLTQSWPAAPNASLRRLSACLNEPFQS